MAYAILNQCARAAAIAVLCWLPTPCVAAEGTACFFNQPDFEGPATCATNGVRKGALDHAFGKRFRSVRLEGNTVVRICEYSGFGGRCMLLTSDQPNVDVLRVSNVESFEVMTRETSGARFYNHVGYADSGVYSAGE